MTDYYHQLQQLSHIGKKPDKPQPTPSMHAFHQGINAGELIKDERLLAVNGWLNPQGILLACRWQSHKVILQRFNLKTEAYAEKIGYIKLSDMHWHLEPRYDIVIPSMKQLQIMYQWHQDNGLSIDYFEWCRSKG